MKHEGKIERTTAYRVGQALRQDPLFGFVLRVYIIPLVVFNLMLLVVAIWGGK